MEVAEARAVVDRELPVLMGLLGLAHRRIAVHFGRREPGEVAEVDRASEYERARIDLDAGQLDDAEELADVLTHEMFHCVLGPLDLSGRYAVEATDEAEQGRLRMVRRYAEEMAVRNLERLWDASGAREAYMAGFRGRRGTAADA